jgi:hypothetical protein
LSEWGETQSGLGVSEYFEQIPIVTNHFYGGIREIDEFGKHFSILTSSIKFRRVPQRKNRSNQLSKAFCPRSVGIGPAI